MYHEKIVFRVASREKIFTSIFKSNYWDNTESVSGPGSTIIETAALRTAWPDVMEKYEIKCVFDAPCGDLNWMKLLLDKVNYTYIGGDIVAEIIERNKIYSNEKISFIKFDITLDKFPNADIWLCRHVLFHLSNKDIYMALKTFVNSEVKYIMTTNCITDNKHINQNIKTGDYRTLNLKLPPFNFPQNPLWEINDFVPPTPPMTIGLWSREEIANLLPQIKKNLNL